MRLVRHVQSVTGLMDTRAVLWSDSTVALTDPWPSVKMEDFRDKPGTDSASSRQGQPDCASRGIIPEKLLKHVLW